MQEFYLIPVRQQEVDDSYSRNFPNKREHHMLNRAQLLSVESNFTFTLVLLYYSP